MAAYLGPPAPLATLLLDPPHSLERQAYQPREMLSGAVNVDGTGVAWWESADEAPRVYVGERPPWADVNLLRLAPRIFGTCQIAAVRSATPGLPSGPGAVAPFAAAGFALAHNGYVERFRESLVAPLLEGLDARALGAIDVLTDSTVLLARLVHAHLEDPSLDLDALVARTALGVASLCAREGVCAQLNLLVARRGRVVALRHAVGMTPNSLYLLEKGARWPSAVVVASEPLDEDTSWTLLPPETLTTLDDKGPRTRPLATPAGRP